MPAQFVIAYNQVAPTVDRPICLACAVVDVDVHAAEGDIVAHACDARKGSLEVEGVELVDLALETRNQSVTARQEGVGRYIDRGTRWQCLSLQRPIHNEAGPRRPKHPHAVRPAAD